MNNLMVTPHGNLEKAYDIHKQIADTDPLFYRQFAAWYSDNGAVRDHTEVFILNLTLSKDEESRNVGLALLRELPPKQVANVVDYIIGGEEKQYKEVKRVVKGKSVNFREPQLDRGGKHIVKKYGLNKNVPRSMHTEISRYFNEREANADWFDSIVLYARKPVKWLYTVLRLPHDKNGRANQILFKNNPPADSKIADLKELAKLSDPNEQAKIIIEKKIPYRVACNVLTNITPAALLALITVMSDQELINNIGSLQKRGILDNPDLKAVIDGRLKKAKRSNKVSALKASVAADNTNVDEETRKQLKDISTAQLKKSNVVINRNIGLLVDISSSMDQAIEVAKRLGSAIATAIHDDNWVETIAFNSGYHHIQPKGKDLDAWENAFKNIRATGSTYAGLSVQVLGKMKKVVDQFVIITDQEENGHPRFDVAFDAYRKQFNVNPSVRIIHCGRGSHQILNSLNKLGDVDVEEFTFNGDYYSVPNLLAFLNKSSRLDLLFEIMSYKLPERKNS